MKKTTKLLAVAMVMGVSTASADVPRTLPSGAPAAGNTLAKGGSQTDYKPVDEKMRLARARASLAEALRAEATAVATLRAYPRALPSGEPSCGTMATRAPCTPEHADRLYEQRLDAVVRAAKRVTEARAELVAAQKAVEAASAPKQVG